MNPEKRKTLQFKVIALDVEKLKELVVKLLGCLRVTFEGKYRKILDLLYVNIYSKSLTALAQFYDQYLIYFLFQDF